MPNRNYWLIKCNVKLYTYDSLLAAPNRTLGWNGVRNAQARNYIRDEIRVGDGILFYHSSCPNPAVVGTATVTSRPHPDTTAQDPLADRYDPDSSPSNPKWYSVDLRAEGKLPRPVTLAQIKSNPNLSGMRLVRSPNQLSVQPVTPTEYEEILRMAGL